MPNKTRCKFVVESITKRQHFNDVEMRAVYDDGLSEENKQFFCATPCGELKFTVANESVNNIEPGQEFYLDLTPVDESR